MIGIDTNILVRAFLGDEPFQSKLAQNCMLQASEKGGLFISSYAILEFAWVLKVKKFARPDIYHAIITLIDSPGVTIGQREVVIHALEKFHKGKADLGDYMIWAESQTSGASTIKTFDQNFLAESPSISLPDKTDL